MNPYQIEALRRYKKVKCLNVLYFLMIGIPLLLAPFTWDSVEGLISRKDLILWLCLYVGLVLIKEWIWKCPKCNKRLARWNENSGAVLKRACRHCGEDLFPEAKITDTKKMQKNLTMSPGFLLVIVVFGFSVVGYGFYLDDQMWIMIGGMINVFGLLPYMLAKRQKICKQCGYVKGGEVHCENCGD